MSRLLCVATKGIVPHQATGAFKRLSRTGINPPWITKGHRSGWGIGYFPAGKLRLVKEPGDAYASVRYDEASHMAGSNPDSRVLLAHLSSAPYRENMGHREGIPPILGWDQSGRHWLLTFDGEIGERQRTGEPYVVDPSKETPAQRLLREILALIPPPEGKGTVSRDAVCAAVGNVLRSTAGEYKCPHINVALTDGGVAYLARLVDKEADWNSVHVCRTARSIIACSEPLEGFEGRWDPVANGQMLVLDTGLNLAKAKL